MSDRQCPQCGASNPSSAEWCSQCFASFQVGAVRERGTLEEETGESDSAALATPDRDQGWVCRVCDTPNPLESTECAACGNSIYRSFGHEPDDLPAVAPERAVLWAIVPGLGHAKAGQSVLGTAIGLLIGITVVFGASFASSEGTRSLGILLLLTGGGLWLVSLLDAFRWANGEKSSVWLRPRVVTLLAALIIGFMVVAFVVTGARVGRQ